MSYGSYPDVDDVRIQRTNRDAGRESYFLLDLPLGDLSREAAHNLARICVSSGSKELARHPAISPLDAGVTFHPELE